MTTLRALDGALIDRVFQPAINRLQVGNVMHPALSCYALYVGMQVSRALVLHAQGTLGQCAPYVAFDVATVCYTYVLAFLFNQDAPFGPYPVRHNPLLRSARLVGLVLALCAMPFIWPLDVDMLLSWGA